MPKRVRPITVRDREFHTFSDASRWFGLPDARVRLRLSKGWTIEQALCLPRRGIPIVLREVEPGVSKPYPIPGMQKLVQTMRKKLDLPSTFTLDACRHGGMTELEETGLTDGQGRALSAHKTQQAYQGYAKRTMQRALAATRKRHAHRLANTSGTEFQNESGLSFQNEAPVGKRG